MGDRQSRYEVERDRAVHPLVKKVADAVKQWAQSLTDGRLVWEVAEDIYPQIWDSWRQDASVYEPWTRHHSSTIFFLAIRILGLI